MVRKSVCCMGKIICCKHSPRERGSSWACVEKAHNTQWSGAVGRLKPRFRFFMAASEPAMLSFILSVAVAVAALARAAAVLAPNLHTWRGILSHVPYCGSTLWPTSSR